MQYRIDTSALQSLIEFLHQRNFKVIGPTRKDGAIIYDEVGFVSDFPSGWTEEQRPGYYRLRERNDAAVFGFTVGPQSWKKFLFPPSSVLFRAQRHSKGFSISNNDAESKNSKPEKVAFFGVRSCELRAIEIQDKVFASGSYQDPQYRKAREQVFIVAVNCSSPSDSCFCSSMGTGPKAAGAFDLALTEILDKNEHYFIVEVGSPHGEKALGSIQHRPANSQEESKAEAVSKKATTEMKRSLNTTGIKELLYQNAEHQEWERVAERCLSCTNCTQVCPTCFCNTIEDSTDLVGSEAKRTRKWDSCFTMDFSYIHGGSIRTSTKARYRQWMTHKLASWIDQFGTSGCVGCGRCITWCPVGIDITEEAKIIRESSNTEQ